MKKIKVDGSEYEVVEDLGYVHSRGCYAKVVKMKNGLEGIVINEGGSWKWAKPIIELTVDGGYRGM